MTRSRLLASTNRLFHRREFDSPDSLARRVRVAGGSKTLTGENYEIFPHDCGTHGADERDFDLV
jgi:hypothetical protein